jgi:hypothetical protein
MPSAHGNTSSQCQHTHKHLRTNSGDAALGDDASGVAATALTRELAIAGVAGVGGVAPGITLYVGVLHGAMSNVAAQSDPTCCNPANARSTIRSK